MYFIFVEETSPGASNHMKPWVEIWSELRSMLVDHWYETHHATADSLAFPYVAGTGSLRSGGGSGGTVGPREAGPAADVCRGEAVGRPGGADPFDG
jgi:hypothetical protein